MLVITKSWVFVLFLSLWVVIASSIHPPPAPPSLNAIVTIQHKYSLCMIHLGLRFFVFSCFAALSSSLWYQKGFDITTEDCNLKILTAWLTTLMAPKLHCYAKLKHRPWCSLSPLPPSLPLPLPLHSKHKLFTFYLA